jgi:hypothetical protein
MRRPQFAIRTLLILMLAAACFFGGIRFERERRRREEEAAATKATPMPTIQTVPKRGRIEETYDKFDYPLNSALRD